MKLPREDMKTFGRCPAWDNFVLVTCEKCDKVVKMEAFESHVTLRHGSKSERSAYHRVLAARAAAALETGQVRLTPAPSRCPSPRADTEAKMELDDEQQSVPSTSAADLAPGLTISGSSSSHGSPTVGQADSSSVHSPTPTRSPSPVRQEPVMDTSPVQPSQSEPQPSPQPRQNIKPAFIGEEADSTTNNVISIPDTDDIPNIEIGIISEGQVTDSINTKFDFSPPVIPPPPLPQRPPIVDSTSSLSSYCPPPAPSTSRPQLANPPPISTISAAPPSTPQRVSSLPPEQPMEIEQTPPPPAPTHYITVSPLSKTSPSPKKLVVGRMGHHLINSGQVVSTGQVVTAAQVLNSSQLINSGQLLGSGQIVSGQVISSGKIISTGQVISSVQSNSGQLISGGQVLSGGQMISGGQLLNSGQVLSSGQQVNTNQLLSKSQVLSTSHLLGSGQSLVPGPTLTSSPQVSIPEKKLTGREREYDPNKHCGVWDADAKRNCTRSLTCKSHSVYLKRKVMNRSGPFDELLAQHKADKEAATAKQAEVGAEAKTSILEQRLKLATPSLVKQEMGRAGVQILQPSQVKVVNKDVYCEDSLHYTTDHPKPLAVCTFGGKRVGGLFISDRSRLLTRRVVRVALASSPLQATKSVPLARQQAMPYIVNFQSGGGGPTRLGTIKLASSQPQQIIVQDAFKTDIQDFKGGIKFELGRKIQQILPSSGSDGAG